MAPVSLRGSVPAASGRGILWTTVGTADPPNGAWHLRPGPAPVPGCGSGRQPRPGEPGGRGPRRRPAAASWRRRAARPGGSTRPPGSDGDPPPAAAFRPPLQPLPPPAASAASGPVGRTQGLTTQSHLPSAALSPGLLSSLPPWHVTVRGTSDPPPSPCLAGGAPSPVGEGHLGGSPNPGGEGRLGTAEHNPAGCRESCRQARDPPPPSQLWPSAVPSHGSGPATSSQSGACLPLLVAHASKHWASVVPTWGWGASGGPTPRHSLPRGGARGKSASPRHAAPTGQGEGPPGSGQRLPGFSGPGATLSTLSLHAGPLVAPSSLGSSAGPRSRLLWWPGLGAEGPYLTSRPSVATRPVVPDEATPVMA